ncbi:MAG: hypothetical protein ACE5I3_07550 [Phycisphaerae bacterium]
MVVLGLTILCLLSVGCAQRRTPVAVEPQRTPPQVVVVAPVLNLSDSRDWDPLKVTDIVASELQSFPDVVVIPVNRTLATLALRGKKAVETPQDALDLASEFNADATVVTAITEYDPYDPPIVGIVMQWYAPARQHATSPGFDPVSASRQASEVAPAAATAEDAAAPLLQVQRVYNAADKSMLADVRSFGSRRSGHGSPYAWRIYVKSQELFVRYCCWASIRSMLLEREQRRSAPKSDEAKRWTQDNDV